MSDEKRVWTDAEWVEWAGPELARRTAMGAIAWAQTGARYEVQMRCGCPTCRKAWEAWDGEGPVVGCKPSPLQPRRYTPR